MQRGAATGAALDVLLPSGIVVRRASTKIGYCGEVPSALPDLIKPVLDLPDRFPNTGSGFRRIGVAQRGLGWRRNHTSTSNAKWDALTMLSQLTQNRNELDVRGRKRVFDDLQRMICCQSRQPS